jgi:hypothetical protein
MVTGLISALAGAMMRYIDGVGMSVRKPLIFSFFRSVPEGARSDETIWGTEGFITAIIA